MKRISVLFLLLLLVTAVTGCNNLSNSNIKEVEIIQEDNTIQTFTKEEHSKEISILVRAVNKVKNQRAELDMPPSDYSLAFTNNTGETLIYSLWLDDDSAFLLANATSDFVQLSSSYAEKLKQIVTDHHAKGIPTVNFYFLVAIFPVLILLLMLADMVGTRKKDRVKNVGNR